MKPEVYVGYHAVSRLDQLGLNRELLLQIARKIRPLLRDCTENDPPTTRGFLLWAKVVRGLRDALLPLGWTRNRIGRCYPLTIHPTERWALAVAGGDEETGVLEGKPTTASTKGRSTKSAVNMNQQVLDLGEITRLKKESGTQTWVLLVHADKETDDIRMEVSLPVKVRKDGYVSEWAERIIIESDPSGSTGAKVVADDDSPSPQGDPVKRSDPLDIDVRRRSAS